MAYCVNPIGMNEKEWIRRGVARKVKEEGIMIHIGRHVLQPPREPTALL